MKDKKDEIDIPFFKVFSSGPTINLKDFRLRRLYGQEYINYHDDFEEKIKDRLK